MPTMLVITMATILVITMARRQIIPMPTMLVIIMARRQIIIVARRRIITMLAMPMATILVITMARRRIITMPIPMLVITMAKRQTMPMETKKFPLILSNLNNLLKNLAKKINCLLQLKQFAVFVRTKQMIITLRFVQRITLHVTRACEHS